ncbi:hypothetical protein PFISCL1PPCAC_17287, partial [Pristionchus fissidentatus]
FGINQEAKIIPPPTVAGTPPPIIDVTVSQVEEGQDGPVVYRKFEIKADDSIIDSLRIYEHKSVEMVISGTLKGAPTQLK